LHIIGKRSVQQAVPFSFTDESLAYRASEMVAEVALIGLPVRRPYGIEAKS
jgi:hypothetical protein